MTKSSYCFIEAPGWFVTNVVASVVIREMSFPKITNVPFHKVMCSSICDVAVCAAALGSKSKGSFCVTYWAAASVEISNTGAAVFGCASNVALMRVSKSWLRLSGIDG